MESAPTPSWGAWASSYFGSCCSTEDPDGPFIAAVVVAGKDEADPLRDLQPQIQQADPLQLQQAPIPNPQADAREEEEEEQEAAGGGQAEAEEAAADEAHLQHPSMDLPQGVFFVELTRESVNDWFGLNFDFSDKKVMEIVTVDCEGSPAAAYNEEAEMARMLLPGRFILSVNGVAGNTHQMQCVWLTSTTVRCQVCTPKKFAVQFDLSDGSKLGVDLSRCKKGMAFLVMDIPNGAVKEWNRANPELEVRRLDRIIAVNGRSGGADMMQELISSDCRQLELVFSRPSWGSALGGECPDPGS